ncbi:MAG: hypothetical protein ACOC59_00245 [Bacteroidota bacterium]
MKRYNNKQKAYSRKKVNFFLQRTMFTFLVMLIATIAIPFIATAISNPDITIIEALATVATGGGTVSLAAMSNIGNIDEISDKHSAPKQIAMRVWLVARDQIDYDESYPTPNSSRELTTIPLKDGEYMHYFDAVDGTPNENATGEKGDIVSSYTRNFSMTLAGNRPKSLDLLEEYTGKGFIIIYSIGEDETKYILGSRYKPMVLGFDRQGGGTDGRYVTLNFTSEYWQQPLEYVGSIVTQSPDTVSEDATTISITDNDRYRLSDGSSETVTITDVSGIGDNDYGRVVQILAPESADNPPEIADNTTFVMIDGETWTAKPGSKISFKILDESTLVEVEGSRVQTA